MHKKEKRYFFRENTRLYNIYFCKKVLPRLVYDTKTVAVYKNKRKYKKGMYKYVLLSLTLVFVFGICKNEVKSFSEYIFWFFCAKGIITMKYCDNNLCVLHNQWFYIRFFPYPYQKHIIRKYMACTIFKAPKITFSLGYMFLTYWDLRCNIKIHC